MTRTKQDILAVAKSPAQAAVVLAVFIRDNKDDVSYVEVDGSWWWAIGGVIWNRDPFKQSKRSAVKHYEAWRAQL